MVNSLFLLLIILVRMIRFSTNHIHQIQEIHLRKNFLRNLTSQSSKEIQDFFMKFIRLNHLQLYLKN